MNNNNFNIKADDTLCFLRQTKTGETKLHFILFISKKGLILQSMQSEWGRSRFSVHKKASSDKAFMSQDLQSSTNIHNLLHSLSKQQEVKIYLGR